MYICPSCDGKGMVTEKLKCSTCYGKGELTELELRVHLGSKVADKYIKKIRSVIEDARD